jgi:hypothetical protein
MGLFQPYGWKTPPVLLAWMRPSLTTLLRSIAAHEDFGVLCF